MGWAFGKTEDRGGRWFPKPAQRLPTEQSVSPHLDHLFRPLGW
jgi:hypothetical protein